MALVSFVWTPYKPNAMNTRHRLEAPFISHPLGTDQYGRDILSGVMVDAVNSIMRFSDLLFGFPSVLTAILITSILEP